MQLIAILSRIGVVYGRPAKGKSVDNGRTDNAFALTARRDNNPLHPRVSLRSTLGYALLRLQRDNYKHEPQN